MISSIFNLQRAALLLVVILTSLASGCGSAPARQPLAIEQAKKADLEAHRALRDGDLLRARELFRKAMLLQQALDNIPASAMAAINLSSVSHRLADDETALRLLDEILADRSAQMSSDLRITAAFRKGIILADHGRLAEAGVALQQATRDCNRQCADNTGMTNLAARLALLNGDFPAALAQAKAVISLGAEKAELANAQRIAATAESALEQNESALDRYHVALALDKELGLSSRIAEDLQGIARVLEKLGRKPEAEIYAQRAQAVTAAAQLLPGSSVKKTLP